MCPNVIHTYIHTFIHTYILTNCLVPGFIDASAFKSAAKELRANTVTDAELHSTLKW